MSRLYRYSWLFSISVGLAITIIGLVVARFRDLANTDKELFDLGLLLVMISTVCALLVEVIIKISELLSKFEEMRDDVEQLRKDIRSEYNDFTRDFPPLSPSLKLDAANILGVARDFLLAIVHPNPHVSKLARDEANTIGIRAADLKRGFHSVSGTVGSPHQELYAVRLCNSRYDAVTLSSINDYWHKWEGESLLEQNKQAISRRVRVRRIFVHPRSKLHQIQHIMALHDAANVDVYYIDSGQMPADLLRDFGLVDDGEAAVQIVDNNSHRQTKFYFRNHRDLNDDANKHIDEIKSIWRQLWDGYNPIHFKDMNWP